MTKTTNEIPLDPRDPRDVTAQVFEEVLGPARTRLVDYTVRLAILGGKPYTTHSYGSYVRLKDAYKERWDSLTVQIYRRLEELGVEVDPEALAELFAEEGVQIREATKSKLKDIHETQGQHGNPGPR